MLKNAFAKEALMFEGLFQPIHLMIIAGIALLFFGPKKLPELGKGLGESIRGFKTAMASEENTLKEKTPRMRVKSHDFGGSVLFDPWAVDFTTAQHFV
jgi:sec-independent protein translocase protein TatA